MRRGASLSESNSKRLPVVADLHDLEGGEPEKSYSRQGSNDSYSNGSSNGYPMDIIATLSPSAKDKSRRRIKHGGASYVSFLTQLSHQNLQQAGGGVFAFTIIVCPFLSIEYCILVLVFSSCCFGAIASLWLSQSVLSCDDGTPEMRQVSDPIREGAEGFLHVQYNAIAKFAVPLAGLIVLSYQFRPSGDEATGVAVLGNQMLGLLAAVGFVFGALCSALSGYTAMWVAARSNIRVASAGRRSYGEALVVCFRGGAFSAVLNLTLCITGVTIFYSILRFLFAGTLKTTDLPMLLVGYGFGSSFVALFMQLGGGIYTKAADVGADLVGKVEQSIPEDDPRNPAVIADLVGDMVGDCVGSSADVFESVAAEIIGAMILGSTLADEANFGSMQAAKFVFFPLVVHAMDIIVSSIGIAFVGVTQDSADGDPWRQLQKGYRVALLLSIVGFYIITKWLLDVPDLPWSGFKFFLCGVVGM